MNAHFTKPPKRDFALSELQVDARPTGAHKSFFPSRQLFSPTQYFLILHNE